MRGQRVFSGAPLEGVVGYSRASRRGSIVAVSGTAPIEADGRSMASSDAYTQAKRCIEIIRQALESLGATLDDVIRTRIFLVRRQDWELVGRAHEEAFGAVRPASTVVVVAGLIDPGWLVEIEADAVVGVAEEGA